MANVPIADVYRAFVGAGFSDPQARALTAETGRENAFQSRYIYGTHSDPANRATNFGLMSFQGPRREQVLDYLRQAGRINEQGQVMPGPETLLAQAQFVRREMETSPEYARTRQAFLANPHIDPESAAEVLGRNYLRWRYDDPRYAAHHNTRRSYLGQIPADMTANAADMAQVGSPVAPASTPAQTRAAQPQAPVYANDFGTAARRFGNFLAPGMVEAPQPLAPDQAQAQIAQQRQMQTDLSQANDAMRAFSALSAYGAAQKAREDQPMSLLQPSIVRGRVVPIQFGRGLL